eukprot:12272995-Karenia_brevis.AAC.1
MTNLTLASVLRTAKDKGKNEGAKEEEKRAKGREADKNEELKSSSKMQEEEEYRKMMHKARLGEDGSNEALPDEGDSPGKGPVPGVNLPEALQEQSQASIGSGYDLDAGIYPQESEDDANQRMDGRQTRDKKKEETSESPDSEDQREYRR